MTKSKAFPHIIGGIAALVLAFLYCYFLCPAINVQNPGLWVLIALMALVYLLGYALCGGGGGKTITVRSKNGINVQVPMGVNAKLFLIPLGIFVLMGLCSVIGSPLFNAKGYAAVMTVADSDFAVLETVVDLRLEVFADACLHE